uniref:Aggrecan n=1 Tax=Rhabditophanes sp. KR3021 TaxID=114890 RepID=A0AC35TXC6_9BILA
DAYGYGASAEGNADFNDFRPFASWSSSSAEISSQHFPT